MAHIWAALVPEPRAALDAHFGAIADELLREMGGRMWRNREAACLGLADLLQVRFLEIGWFNTGKAWDAPKPQESARQTWKCSRRTCTGDCAARRWTCIGVSGMRHAAS
jgi:hypothetical protein